MTVALRRVSLAELRAMNAERTGYRAPAMSPDDAARLERAFGRPVGPEEAVREIIADVRSRGDAAVHDWTQRIDGVDVATTRVPAEALDSAWAQTEPPLCNALLAAAERLRTFHELQTDIDPRGTSTAYLRPEPIRRAGCYVPGGRAAYPSTVLMAVIPAQVAGVESIAVASPPGQETPVHRLVAAAARMLGVTEVHAMGGAQAVAALACGTAGVAAVDVLVGPGNLFVTLAKRELFGTVGIDQLAGPSEILVIASTGADATLIAADLVSQLEHDPLAWAVCLTDDAALADAVSAAFADAASTAARAGVIAAAAGHHAALVVCETLEDALHAAEAFAPEHLALQGAAAEALRDRVRAAGAIFCGALSPVSMGDYIAGPNHTLPTQGAARYRGPLSVMDFMRWPSVVQLSRAEFEALAPVACALADAEGLAAHSAAIRARLPLLERIA